MRALSIVIPLMLSLPSEGAAGSSVVGKWQCQKMQFAELSVSPSLAFKPDGTAFMNLKINQFAHQTMLEVISTAHGKWRTTPDGITLEFDDDEQQVNLNREDISATQMGQNALDRWTNLRTAAPKEWKVNGPSQRSELRVTLGPKKAACTRA